MIFTTSNIYGIYVLEAHMLCAGCVKIITEHGNTPTSAITIYLRQYELKKSDPIPPIT